MVELYLFWSSAAYNWSWEWIPQPCRPRHLRKYKQTPSALVLYMVLYRATQHRSMVKDVYWKLQGGWWVGCMKLRLMAERRGVAERGRTEQRRRKNRMSPVEMADKTDEEKLVTNLKWEVSLFTHQLQSLRSWQSGCSRAELVAAGEVLIWLQHTWLPRSLPPSLCLSLKCVVMCWPAHVKSNTFPQRCVKMPCILFHLLPITYIYIPVCNCLNPTV